MLELLGIIDIQLPTSLPITILRSRRRHIVTHSFICRFLLFIYLASGERFFISDDES